MMQQKLFIQHRDIEASAVVMADSISFRDQIMYLLQHKLRLSVVHRGKHDLSLTMPLSSPTQNIRRL